MKKRRKHLGKMTARSLAALRQDLRAYDASAYPMGKVAIRNLLVKHHGMTERGANRVISSVLKR